MRSHTQRRHSRKRGRKVRNLAKEGRRIDYKDTDLISQFVTESKKIISRRGTGLNAKEQRRVATAIKRARFMALLPYTTLHK
ncbi:MAG: 30S ribosomal protein S18 [Thermodesulfobacteriota bacterium]